MATATTPKIVTYEEWLTMPEVQDAIEEVVNGEIRIMPPNKSPHARVITRLTFSFVRQVNEETTEVFGSVFGLVIRKNPLTCRVPDLALFHKKTMVEQDGYIHSPPELVIEVLSPSNTRRDPQEKLLDYQSIGVPEVWLVSNEARSIEVLFLSNGQLQTKGIVNQGTLSPKHFPEVSVEVAAIWPKYICKFNTGCVSGSHSRLINYLQAFPH